MSNQPNHLQDLVAQVASAYFSNSHVTPTEIPAVISQIAASLNAVSASAPEVAESAAGQAKATPAQVRKSITPDALISFEDGRGYKTLRRHLSVRGMTPEEYREKWGLPASYPMVSPNYSATRSQMAKTIGLGQIRSRAAGKGKGRRKPVASAEA